MNSLFRTNVDAGTVEDRFQVSFAKKPLPQTHKGLPQREALIFNRRILLTAVASP
jgi:hypothetical protein